MTLLTLYSWGSMCAITVWTTVSLFTSTQKCLRLFRLNFELYRRERCSFMASIAPRLLVAMATLAPEICLARLESYLEWLLGCNTTCVDELGNVMFGTCTCIKINLWFRYVRENSLEARVGHLVVSALHKTRNVCVCVYLFTNPPYFCRWGGTPDPLKKTVCSQTEY